MSEMIEKVARAIWEKATPLKPGPWNDDLNKWDRASDQERFICMGQARAAIAAMQEPTEAMIGAGEQAHYRYPSHIDNARAKTERAWGAMIDAALKD